MKTKLLTQLRELIASALKSQTNLSKSFQTFFIEMMELVLTHTGRLHPDGEVWPLMREQVPPEFQEVFRLAFVQSIVPGIDKRTSHCNRHRSVLYRQVWQAEPDSEPLFWNNRRV